MFIPKAISKRRRHQLGASDATFYVIKITTPRTARKAGFILRTKIYAVYADHFAHVGRVLSATNADLRRSDRADGKYKHSLQYPDFYDELFPPFEALLTWKRGC